MAAILSYGAGVNSTALLIFLIDNNYPLDYVVFADTGDELPETYEYLAYIQLFMIRYKIPLVICRNKHKETLFDRCIRRKVIPSQLWRWCTRDFKVLPIYAFYRSLRTKVTQYIAIDYGEVERLKDANVPYVSNQYPLVDNKIDRAECIRIIEKAELLVPTKSGCLFCPYNNEGRWAHIASKYPALFQKAVKLDKNNKHYGRQSIFQSKGSRNLCGGDCML